MSDTFYNNPRRITTDSGEKVEMAKLPLSRAYKDEESIKLSRKYEVNSNIGFVSSSFGSAHTEGFAEDLFRYYSAMGGFWGFPKKDLKKLDNDRARMELEPKYLRSRLIEGVEVLFPTEEFLTNQKIELRK